MKWISHFRVNSRQAEHYGGGRVYLAGDACHCHSPLGGQGMNMGFQDAKNIAWKLAYAAKGAVPTAFLETYEEERRGIEKKKFVVRLKLRRRVSRSGTVSSSGCVGVDSVSFQRFSTLWAEPLCRTFPSKDGHIRHVVCQWNTGNDHRCLWEFFEPAAIDDARICTDGTGCELGQAMRFQRPPQNRVPFCLF